MGRDFSGQNLRGRNFRGQDLRGASFVNADIRGANFTDAELQGADFTGAIAGLQKRWAIGQGVLAFCISIVVNFLLFILIAFSLLVLFRESFTKSFFILPAIAIILLIGFLLILIRTGFTSKSLSNILIISIISSLIIPILSMIAGIGSTYNYSQASFGIVIFLFFSWMITSFTFLIVLMSAIVFINLGSFLISLTIVVGLVSLLLFISDTSISLMVRTTSIMVLDIFSFMVAVAGFYVALRSNKGDEKFAIVRSIGLAFGALGGTSFSGSDLTDANFTQAKLKSTNFANSRKRITNLTRTRWQDSKKLDKARPGNSIFSNFKVLQLLTTGQGINQDFSQFNLRGANLDSAQLNGANLKNADLTQASLHQADLQNANLTELQAVGTDFTKTYLTGACLEAWNIDQANLSGIDCAFYFLRETPDNRGSRDRRPHDPDRTYEPGDAEKMLTEARNVVEVLLKHCTNAKDLAQSLQRLTETYPESILQKLERKDNSDFLVTLTVPPDTDKANVETLLHTAYDEIRALRGEVKDLHTLRAVDLKDALLAIANNPANLIQTIQQTTGDHTMTTQENQNISAGSGSFINTGTLNATNSTLGIISGNATTSIGQLPPAAANEPDLKTALTDLQIAIESSSLSDDDKAEALEQVKSIADAGKTPKDNALQKTVKTALKVLKGTIADLPATEDLVKVMIKIAPIVAAFFGMPAM